MMIAALALLSIVLSAEAADSIAAHGRLLCPSDPEKAKNVAIKLQDKDTGSLDNDFAWTNTDSQGYFNISGESSEAFGLGTLLGNRIDPILKISHSCNDQTWLADKIGLNIGKPCDRYWRLELPTDYINSDKSVYVGELNLEVKLEKEGTNCI